MSDYRVFDKTKNQYDATVMSSLFVDDVPKGWSISASRDNPSRESVSDNWVYYNTEASLTFTTFRQNPSGGIYTEEDDFPISTIENDILASNSDYGNKELLCYTTSWNDKETVIFKLTIDNQTPFSFRIYNLDTTTGTGTESSFPEEGEHTATGFQTGTVNISYEPGFTPEKLLNIDAIIEGNQKKVFETKVIFSDWKADGISFGYPSTEMSMYLNSFYIQRIF